MSHRTKAHLVIPILALALMAGSLSVVLVEEVSADSLTIIDYDYEGIMPDTTQYFVLREVHLSDT